MRVRGRGCRLQTGMFARVHNATRERKKRSGTSAHQRTEMYTSAMGIGVTASFDQYAVGSHGAEGTHTALRKMIIFNIKRLYIYAHTHVHGSNYRAMLHIVAITEGNIDEANSCPVRT